MNRLLSTGGARTIGAAMLAFAAMLLAAPAPSTAATYTLTYTGTVTSVDGALAALGVAVGDAVLGSLTIDPIKTTPDSVSSGLNEFDQATASFSLIMSHGGSSVTVDQGGGGKVLAYGSPNTVSGVRFSFSGTDAALETTFWTGPNGAPLTSLTGLKTSAAALIASFGGTSPQAFGTLDYHPGSDDSTNGTAAFSIDVASTPLPATLPLIASALGGLGFVGWRRKRSRSGASGSVAMAAASAP